MSDEAGEDVEVSGSDMLRSTQVSERETGSVCGCENMSKEWDVQRGAVMRRRRRSCMIITQSDAVCAVIVIVIDVRVRLSV